MYFYQIVLKKSSNNFEFNSEFDEVRRLSLSSINSFATASTELNQNNTQLPTFFAFQILLKMNKISNIHSSELNIFDAQWPDVGKN